MKKIVYISVVLFLFFTSFSKAQSVEASAQGEEIDFILEEQNVEVLTNSEVSNEVWEMSSPKKDVATTKAKTEIKKEKKIEKVNKFLNSRVGKFIVKLAAKKAVNKKYKKEWKAAKGDKTKRKILKEKKKEEVKALSNNMRVGIILILIGIALSLLLDSNLSVLWIIAIVAGIVFIILDLV